MTDRKPTSLGQRRREAEERVRRKNLEDRGMDNVVPLRRPKPARPPTKIPALPRWATHPLALWAAIVAVLIVWYLLRGLF